MDEIKRESALRLPRLPKRRWTVMEENAAALAVLMGGGYAALRLMSLLFRALGVD